MTTDFQIIAADKNNFEQLFNLTSEELAKLGAIRKIADQHPGYPCRVSLQDAAAGEEVILTVFAHHAVRSPYQASGPVYIRKNAETAKPAINEVPSMLLHRQLSVRAYTGDAMMISSRVIPGVQLKQTIRDYFSDNKVAYLHIHNAGPGCYNCAVERVAISQ